MREIGNWQEGFYEIAHKDSVCEIALPNQGATLDILEDGSIRVLYIGGDGGGDSAYIINHFDDLKDLFTSNDDKLDLSELLEYLSDNHYILCSYGQPLVGVWRCKNFSYGQNKHEYFPNQLEKLKLKPPFFCPDCGELLTYDEEA